MRRLAPPPPTVWLALALLLVAGGCKLLAGLPAKPEKNLVIVLGTLGEGHLEPALEGEGGYDLERLEQILRRVDPHYVLCEIPPEIWPRAWRGFIRTGEVEDPWFAELPEYREVLFPLALEGRFQVVPCSGWDAAADERQRLLIQQWASTRVEDVREVADARELGLRRLAAEGLDRDAMGVHSARYDEIVAEMQEPYERLFSRDLGEAGWTQVHAAHSALISEALGGLTGNGQRVLVMFGSFSKYRLREGLVRRDDIVLRRLSEVME